MMELAEKNSFLTVLCFSVLVLCPFVRGECNRMGPGADEMYCFASFGMFFVSKLEEKIDSDPNAAVQLICSSEGKSEFDCVREYTKDCQELLSGPASRGNPLYALEKIPGFDLQRAVKEGLDGFCALKIGPCSEVKNCYETPHGDPTGGMAKRDTSTSTNYYMLFQELTGVMCGPMQEQMTCVLKAMEKCPASVRKDVEGDFDYALKMSMPEAYLALPYEDIKRFIQEKCPKLPKDFSEDTCTMGVYVSQNFTMCNENVTIKYSLERNCEVHDLSRQCIDKNVQPRCGKESAMFLVQNTHMIFPGIPNNCDNKDISGSDVKRTTFGIMLICTFLILFIR